MKATKMSVLFMGLLMEVVFMVADATPGSATPNPINIPSACYGYAPLPKYNTAVSANLFKNKKGCGDKYTVTCTGAANLGDRHPCTGKSVTVTVVDLCPAPGCNAPFDLCEEAFKKIADPAAGIVRIDYKFLSAGINNAATNMTYNKLENVAIDG